MITESTATSPAVTSSSRPDSLKQDAASTRTVRRGKIAVKVRLDNGDKLDLEAPIGESLDHGDQKLNQHDEKLLEGFYRLDWEVTPQEAALLHGLLTRMRDTQIADNAAPSQESETILTALCGDHASLSEYTLQVERRIEKSIARKQENRAKAGLEPLERLVPVSDLSTKKLLLLLNSALATLVADHKNFKAELNTTKEALQQATAELIARKTERKWLVSIVNKLIRSTWLTRVLVRRLVPELFTGEGMPKSLTTSASTGA